MNFVMRPRVPGAGQGYCTVLGAAPKTTTKNRVGRLCLPTPYRRKADVAQALGRSRSGALRTRSSSVATQPCQRGRKL